MLYQVGLNEERYRLIKGYSTGMKQRVKLAQSIVHYPSLIFLDEPLRLTNVLGATAVLIGVALTRTAPQAAPAEPCEP